MIEQAEAAGGPLRLGVHGMRTALAGAQAVVDAAERPRTINSAGELLRRLGG